MQTNTIDIQEILLLREALKGRVTDHHRFLLRMLMDQIGHLEGLIARFDLRIEEAMAPFAAAAHLQTLTGIGVRSSEVIVSEIGTDMERFPSSGHLSS